MYVCNYFINNVYDFILKTFLCKTYMVKIGKFEVFSDAFPYPVHRVTPVFPVYLGRLPQCKHSALSGRVDLKRKNLAVRKWAWKPVIAKKGRLLVNYFGSFCVLYQQMGPADLMTECVVILAHQWPLLFFVLGPQRGYIPSVPCR